MRIIALSLNPPTDAFLAAIKALKAAGHVVDRLIERPFGDTTNHWSAAFLSLGDYAAVASMRIKLFFVKAAIELPTCYFAECPAGQYQQTNEFFWKSAVLGDTVEARMHRNDMLRALKSDWKPKLEQKLDEWRQPSFHPLVPAFPTAALNGSVAWDATPFYVAPYFHTNRTTKVLATVTDDVPWSEISKAVAVHRRRPSQENVFPTWSPLAVACSNLGTLYFDTALQQPLSYDDVPAMTDQDIETELKAQAKRILGRQLEPRAAANDLSAKFINALRGPNRDDEHTRFKDADR